VAVVEWNDVVTKLPAPELAALPEPAQEDILEFVHETLNVAALGGEGSARLRRARMLLAAHLAHVTGSGGSVAAGPVISESTGRISRTYAEVLTSGDFSGSSYGQEFTRLVRNTPACRLPRAF
jgi:hypothetical protein